MEWNLEENHASLPIFEWTMRNLSKNNEQVLILVARRCFIAGWIYIIPQKSFNSPAILTLIVCVRSFFSYLLFFSSLYRPCKFLYTQTHRYTRTFDVKCRQFHCLFDSCVYNYQRTTASLAPLMPSPFVSNSVEKKVTYWVGGFISHPIFLVHKLKAQLYYIYLKRADPIRSDPVAHSSTSKKYMLYFRKIEQ